jgi:hypothetical protein
MGLWILVQLLIFATAQEASLAARPTDLRVGAHSHFEAAEVAGEEIDLCLRRIDGNENSPAAPHIVTIGSRQNSESDP